MGTEEISTLKLYIKLYKLMFPLAGHVHSVCSDQHLENHREPFLESFIRLYTHGTV